MRQEEEVSAGSEVAPTAPSPFAVRPLEDDEHLDTYYRLSAETFLQPSDPDVMAAALRRRDEAWPDFHPGQRRGIVEEGAFLGGYVMYEREMRLGSVTVPTACISAVVVAPERRGQGAGRVLMEDALRYARQRGHGLLLLNGIPDFYRGFDYADVFDRTAHSIRVDAIPRDDVAGHRVRPATMEDAGALLELYGRHNGSYSGSFAWGPEHMHHQLQFRLALDRGPLVVEDDDGALRGYLYAEREADRAIEVGADTWPAALALLRRHALSVTEATDESPVIWWRVPPVSRTSLLLADHISPARSLEGERPTPRLQSVTQHDLHAGWQARPADLHLLLERLVPLWQERWERSNRPQDGTIDLEIGGVGFALRLTGQALVLDPGGAEAVPSVVLSLPAFTQLIVGYRPLWWIAEQPEEQVPEDVMEPLQILFPTGGFWIAGTDGF